MRFRFLSPSTRLLLWTGVCLLAACRAPRPSRWNSLDATLAPRMALAKGLWLRGGALPGDDPARLRRLEDAAQDLRHLLELAPRYFPAHRLLQDVRLEKDGVEAREEYRQVGEDADADEITLALAARAWLPEDPERARTLLERSLERSPRFPWAHYGLGLLAWRQGDHDAAEDHVARALRFDQTLGEAWLLRAELQDAAGDWEAAIEALKTHQELEPENLDVLLRLAHLQIATEDPRLARHGEQRLEKILARTGDPPAPDQRDLRRDALQDMGVALIIQEKPREALERFREVLRLDETYLRAHYNIAWIHEYMLKDDEAALAALEDYLKRAARIQRERTFDELLDELFFVEVNMQRLRDRIAAREAEQAEQTEAAGGEGLP